MEPGEDADKVIDMALRKRQEDADLRRLAGGDRASAAEKRAESDRTRKLSALVRRLASDRRHRLANQHRSGSNDLITGIGLRSSAARDRDADERRRLADIRDAEADERERVADQRESAADQRERLADIRESQLDEREHRLDEEDQTLS